MLSRVADSMFWMSRYVERAENVARFVDVNWHLILDSSTKEEEKWMALVNTTGDRDAFEKRHGKATRQSVIRFLTFDVENANSIFSCVRSARENARSIRDTISSEMWEQINTFYLMLHDSRSGNRALESPYDFFSHVRQASHLFLGVTDTTMSHNEGWNFCRLGRYLERTDKTSRIVDVKYYVPAAKNGLESKSMDAIQWAAVLKSASAMEMYRKRHRQVLPDRVVEFLLLDREFPRAALNCVLTADQALHAITGTAQGMHESPAERRLGMLCSDLLYADVHEILSTGLHEYVDNLQTKLNVAGDAINETFFSLKHPRSSMGTQIQIL
jgi:uncharacterized alpha-E superfamily protein